MTVKLNQNTKHAKWELLYEFRKYALHEWLCSILMVPVVCGFRTWNNAYAMLEHTGKGPRLVTPSLSSNCRPWHPLRSILLLNWILFYYLWYFCIRCAFATAKSSNTMVIKFLVLTQYYPMQVWFNNLVTFMDDLDWWPWPCLLSPFEPYLSNCWAKFYTSSLASWAFLRCKNSLLVSVSVYSLLVSSEWLIFSNQ